MNILVCVKQVPNTKHMTIDSDTHRLVRHGISSILNPADRYTLEKSLRFRDQHGGTVTVISMGALQAVDVLVSAYMVGADRCLLLTDPAFAGSDTFATASVLTAAIHYEQQRTGIPFDIIFCGNNTIDGETGQVGPEMAELLGIPNFTNISRLEYNGSFCQIEYSVDNLKLNVNSALPLLVTYPLSDDAYLRASLPERLKQAEEIQIPQLSLNDLAPWLNQSEIGLHGSATRVIKSFVPSTGRKGIRIDQGTAKEKAACLVNYLTKDGFWGSQKISSFESSEPETSVIKGSGRICVFVEQNSNGSCKNISLELLTPAIRIGNAARLKTSAVLIGSDNTAAIAELQQYPIDEIISCEAPVFEQLQLHDYVSAAGSIVEHYHPEGLLIGGTDLGKELAARIAARFHTGLTAECNGIRYDRELGGIIWERPAYGGKLMAEIICKEKRPQMGTVREGVFEKPGKSSSLARISVNKSSESIPNICRPIIIPVQPVRSSLADKVTFISKSATPGFVPKEDNIRSIVVGMGRGIRDIDGFDICCDFADVIGAEIGASRGAAELRIVSQKYLIGSNGKTIRPSVYFACGISGSMQHMTGVLDSSCIVAINRDPKAEIFQYADYCVVGDLFQILPELQRLMEKN